MTIGLAIVIAAVLFLIDRNHVWPQVWSGVKQTLKFVVALIILCAILWGGYFVWSIHQQHVEAAKAAADDAAWRTAFDKPALNQNAPYDTTHRRPAAGEAIDCYDGYRLLPDEGAAFGGKIMDCAPGKIPRPKSERANLPAAELQHVERIEACQKKEGAEPNSTPAKFKACSDTK